MTQQTTQKTTHKKTQSLSRVLSNAACFQVVAQACIYLLQRVALCLAARLLDLHRLDALLDLLYLLLQAGQCRLPAMCVRLSSRRMHMVSDQVSIACCLVSRK